METLGSRLKEARDKKHLTQVQVAEKLGISNGTLSGYERNYRDPDTSTLANLARLYGVSTDYLSMGSGKEGSSTNESENDKEDRIILETIKNIKNKETKRAAIEVLKGLAGK